MTHGPGAARAYLYHLTTEEALCAVQALLEREELQLFREFLTDVLHQPSRQRVGMFRSSNGRICCV